MFIDLKFEDTKERKYCWTEKNEAKMKSKNTLGDYIRI